jgi:glycerol-3-phosphate dehydrogenase
MKRDLARMASKSYDIVVIGGGIFGACIAYDAATRGYSVALVEKNDFGAATSYASLRVIHGGLRYLQSGNLPLMMNMKKEQLNWLQIAPHLIHPMPCLISTYKNLPKSKLAYAAALLVNNSSNWLLNQKIRPDRRLSYGRLISQQECLQHLPAIEKQDLTGAAIWDEAYMESSERLLLTLLHSASQAGAEIANYAQVADFLKENNRVCGVTVEDQINGQRYEINAKLVINSAGAWVDRLLHQAGRRSPEPSYHLSLAFNIVTGRLFDGFMAGFPARGRKNGSSRLSFGPVLFATPWENYTLIGTRHLPYHGSPDENPIREQDVRDFLKDIHSACPALGLRMADVCGVVHGYLPMVKTDSGRNDVKLVRDIQIFDHASEGIQGIITVIGVRYTLARYIAQRAVNLAGRKLGAASSACRTASLPLAGGNFTDFNDLVQKAQANCPPDISSAAMNRLVRFYGSDYPRVLALLHENPHWGAAFGPDQAILTAQIVYAAREEMALKLYDVLQRRVGLFPLADADHLTLERTAEIMGQEHHWNDQQRQATLQEARYTTRRYPYRSTKV